MKRVSLQVDQSLVSLAPSVSRRCYSKELHLKITEKIKSVVFRVVFINTRMLIEDQIHEKLE
jgi:hypothetical protein